IVCQFSTRGRICGSRRTFCTRYRRTRRRGRGEGGRQKAEGIHHRGTEGTEAGREEGGTTDLDQCEGRRSAIHSLSGTGEGRRATVEGHRRTATRATPSGVARVSSSPLARAAAGTARLEKPPDGTCRQKRASQRLIRLEGVRQALDDTLGSCAMNLRRVPVPRAPIQLRARGVETPRHRGNVESLEDGQATLDIAVCALPVLLGHRDPRLCVPAERLHVGFGGRQGRGEEAVGVAASPAEAAGGEPDIGEPEERVQPPEPLQEELGGDDGSLTSLQQRLFKTGGRLIRHAQYFVLQLAEGYMTQRLFRQIVGRIERLAWHPT